LTNHVLSRFHLLSLLIDRTNQVKEGCVEAVKPSQIKLKETIIMLLEIDIEDGKYIRI